MNIKVFDPNIFRASLRTGYRSFRHGCCQLHPSPVLVLGFQKSGTSAITALLGIATGKSYAIDFPDFRQGLLERLQAGSCSLRWALRWRAGRQCARELVKECNLILFYEQLRRCYPHSPKVFVLREPRANIRSVLDRLHLPGQMGRGGIHNWVSSPEWRGVLDGGWLGLPNPEPPLSLAWRWRLAAETYWRYRREMELVHYEAFCRNKSQVIHDLADRLCLPVRRDITPWLDFPFQSPGTPRTDWTNYFGAEQLARIEGVCGPVWSLVTGER